MGMNNENARRLVFDIETIPLPDAVRYIESAEAPSNYKDPEKIAAYIAAENAKALDRCGLDVDLCQICAIGVQGEWDEAPRVRVGLDERDGIEWFWREVASAHLVGFNCVTFDLPVLLRRSLYLGIPTPDIALDKYRHPRVTDILQVLSYHGAIKMRGLSFYAKRFDLGYEDDITGADIARLVAAEDWPSVIFHVTKDVQKTAALAGQLGLFRAPYTEVAF